MKLESQFEILKNNLFIDDQSKSSYWKNQFKDFKINNLDLDEIKKFGFGNFEANNFFRRMYHAFFLILIYRGNYFNKKCFNIFKKIAIIQNKVINLDVFRHISAFEYLNNKDIFKSKIENICIIGDGRCNFLSPSLKSNLFKKIISVNLTETLLCDLLILENDPTVRSDEVSVVLDENHLDNVMDDEKIKIILVPSSNSKILSNKNIKLFVNICSFQEIDYNNINEYFNIIKSNHSFFYCCNREYNELPGGEVIEFNNYPWGNPDYFVKENCPWITKYYDYKSFPFIKKYPNHIHCLVKYN